MKDTDLWFSTDVSELNALKARVSSRQFWTAEGVRTAIRQKENNYKGLLTLVEQILFSWHDSIEECVRRKMSPRDVLILAELYNRLDAYKKSA
jgi:hypothetical protein